MRVSGAIPIGVVLLAPFYNPLLLAEQIGTLAAFAEGCAIGSGSWSDQRPSPSPRALHCRSRSSTVLTARGESATMGRSYTREPDLDVGPCRREKR